MARSKTWLIVYNPDPILIHVREDGQPFIVEGNTRVVEAINSNRPTIQAEIKYLRGAEEVEGPLSPDKIFQPENIKSNISKAAGRFPADKPVIDKFTTSRGSTYELFDDASTQRNRSGVGHKDTSTGLQPVSNKTVFVDKEGLVYVGGIFQNPDIATRLNPVFDAKGNITSMTVDLTEDFGPRRAGERMAEVPVTTRPAVGKYPVEIMSPESPRGSSGRGVHFGSEIIDVQPQTPKAGQASRKSNDLKKYKSGGSIERNPYRRQPRAI